MQIGKKYWGFRNMQEKLENVFFLPKGTKQVNG